MNDTISKPAIFIELKKKILKNLENLELNKY